MLKYFKTDDQIIHEEEKLCDGCWVRMINPTQEECEYIAEQLMVDIEDVQAALDPEESSRIELQDGYTLILVDIPATEVRHKKHVYTTIPLGIICAFISTNAYAAYPNCPIAILGISGFTNNSFVLFNCMLFCIKSKVKVL